MAGIKRQKAMGRRQKENAKGSSRQAGHII